MTKPGTRTLQFAAPFLAIIQLSATIHLCEAEVDVSCMPASPPPPAVRVPQTSMGVTQLPNEKLDWLLNAKFGMFIHWGLYSGVGRGEWVMQNEGILPEDYRQYAYPASGEACFDAANYHPEAWAQLAKDAGMKFMCLTTRHHDGFCLHQHANFAP
jgi:alpha-L-fucosidase